MTKFILIACACFALSAKADSYITVEAGQSKATFNGVRGYVLTAYDQSNTDVIARLGIGYLPAAASSAIAPNSTRIRSN